MRPIRFPEFELPKLDVASRYKLPEDVRYYVVACNKTVEFIMLNFHEL